MSSRQERAGPMEACGQSVRESLGWTASRSEVTNETRARTPKYMLYPAGSSKNEETTSRPLNLPSIKGNVMNYYSQYMCPVQHLDFTPETSYIETEADERWRNLKGIILPPFTYYLIKLFTLHKVACGNSVYGR